MREGPSDEASISLLNTYLSEFLIWNHPIPLRSSCVRLAWIPLRCETDLIIRRPSLRGAGSADGGTPDRNYSGVHVRGHSQRTPATVP